ncbi:type II toxin-antitoxin system VapC family toxin [Salininema proteolyticum]|uniref:Ribonuclease VapC n=1 Tax=Salininema proteolyticum TaxID=1607685 RepID=A0ABV8U130_9ACTN
MIIVADTSALLAAFSPAESDHHDCLAYLNAHGQFVYSPMVLTEFDHLVRARSGRFDTALDAHRQLLARVEAGSDLIADIEMADHLAAAGLREKHRDMELDLADALGVVLARKYSTDLIFTLDEGDFRRLRPLDDFTHFRIMPKDVV